MAATRDRGGAAGRRVGLAAVARLTSATSPPQRAASGWMAEDGRPAGRTRCAVLPGLQWSRATDGRVVTVGSRSRSR